MLVLSEQMRKVQQQRAQKQYGKKHIWMVLLTVMFYCQCLEKFSTLTHKCDLHEMKMGQSVDSFQYETLKGMTLIMKYCRTE